MSRTTLKAFAATVLLSLAGAATAGDSDRSLQEISGYREWARINEKPIEVSTALALGG